MVTVKTPHQEVRSPGSLPFSATVMLCHSQGVWSPSGLKREDFPEKKSLSTSGMGLALREPSGGSSMKVQSPEDKGREGPGVWRGGLGGQRLRAQACRETPLAGSCPCEALAVGPRTDTSSVVPGVRNAGKGDGPDECFPKVT